MNETEQKNLFATIGHRDSEGATLIFDGESSATAKKYKCNTAIPFFDGQRVMLIKIDGTYVVAFPVGAPGKASNMNQCPTEADATAALCANWINAIISALANLGLMRKNGW